MTRTLTKTEVLLFEKHYNNVYKVVYAFCGDRHMAEDALQDGFLQAFKSIKQLRDIDKFPVWVTTISINKLKTHYAKEKNKRQVSPEKLQLNIVYHESYNHIETIEDLKNTLNKIDYDQRQVFILYYLFDVPLSDIAYMLQTPKGTVKSRLFRARKKLRQLFTINSVREWGR